VGASPHPDKAFWTTPRSSGGPGAVAEMQAGPPPGSRPELRPVWVERWGRFRATARRKAVNLSHVFKGRRWRQKLLEEARALVAALAAGVAAAATWAWCLLPFRLRRALRLGRSPALPKVHACPSVARILSAESLQRALAAEGWDRNGCCFRPLADLPRWRVEWLVGRGVRDLDLYRTALTSVSAIPDAGEWRHLSNERLEYLGDAVLSLTIRRYLLTRFPECDEGRLTALESRLTSSAALYEYALHMSLQAHVAGNAGHMRASQHYAPRVLEDALEALIGALFLDRGLEACDHFILNLLDSAAGLETLGTEGWDYRGQLQEVCRAANLPKASFKPGGRVRQRGKRPPACSVDVYLGEKLVGSGSGLTYHLAEHAAALDAMEHILKHHKGAREGRGAGGPRAARG